MGYKYSPKQPRIEAVCQGGEPYASVTVCIPEVELGEYETILDTNNLPDSLDVLVKSNCVVDTGKTVDSGYCEYPIVKVVASIN